MTNVYAKRRAEVGSKVHFILPGHEIALDIPDGGIQHRNGWSVQPLMEPKLSRNDVKSVEKGQQFNVFQVLLEFEGDVDSENLSHTLKLLGVEPADACIIITRDRPLTDNEIKDILKEAMQKGYIESRLILLVLVGVAGSGKTHFKRLVLGLPPPECRVSTALAEAAVRSMSICHVSIDKGVQWRLVDPKAFQDMVADAIKKGVPLEISQGSQELPTIAFGTVETSESDMSVTSEGSEVPHASGKVDVPNLGKGQAHEPSASRIPQKKGKYSQDRVQIPPESLDALKSINLELLQQIRSCSGSGKLLDVDWVYIVDSGGQPQFREMLPHFMYDSSAFIMMQKLNESLGTTTSIEYRGEGSKMCGAPYQSKLTNEQVLYQYFQAIQSHKSRVFVVGTFRDKEHECSESRAEKDKVLLEAFRPVVGDNLALYQPGNPDQFMFPLNCKAPEPQDEVTAKKFRHTVMKLCSGKRVKIPLPWFVLEQLLKQLAAKLCTKVLSIEECYELAKKVHMTRRMGNAAIRFLGRINIVFYKPNILPNVVFSDSQAVLDSITELVRCSHELNGNASGQQTHDMRGVEWLDFRDKGKITIKFLEEKRFTTHYREGLFEAKHFLELLKGMLLAASLGNDEYFMPSLLPDLKLEQVAKKRVPESGCPAPMTIRYLEKWLPVGLVPSLVAELQNSHGWKPLEGKGKPLCMYHNCMEFELPGGKPGSVVLIDSIAFLEIHLHLSTKKAYKIATKVCPKIRKMILAGIEEAHMSLHSGPAEVEEGFLCNSECGLKTAHIAALDDEGEMWTCSRECRVGDDLCDRHTVWFENASDHKHTLQGFQDDFILPPDEITDSPWFFCQITREDAERKLLQVRIQSGTFLVRESESTYALSIRCGDEVNHYVIMNAGGFYVNPDSKFTTLEELVRHYQEDSDGLCCRLTNICPKFEKDEWEIERTSIKLHKRLGARQFGEVWEGLWNGTTPVAVKVPKPGSKANFLSEVHIMKKLRHEKLIQLYAVCTVDEPMYIITERMKNWNLLEYLRTGEGQHLRLSEIINIAAQVASGMDYMELHNYIHRDLQARNVSVGEGNIVKIADFSLTTEVNITDRIDLAREGEKFCIKWTAPEAALYKRFSSKSDVWSFGILIYELITHGRIPYPGMTSGEILAKVEQGYRMPPPPGCPDELYQTMLDCWKPDAEKRPAFEYLKFHLEDDFTSVNK